LVIRDGFDIGVFSSGDVSLKLKHWQGMTRMAMKEQEEIVVNNKNGDELIVNGGNNDEKKDEMTIHNENIRKTMRNNENGDEGWQSVK
jgi:hypothetical protein